MCPHCKPPPLLTVSSLPVSPHVPIFRRIPMLHSRTPNTLLGGISLRNFLRLKCDNLPPIVVGGVDRNSCPGRCAADFKFHGWRGE